MGELDDFLDPFEKVIWRGKPDKKAHRLASLGGIPFALIFFAGYLYIIFVIGDNIIGPSLYILAWVVGLIVIPPLYQLRKFPNEEYMLTDGRLLIKTGKKEDDIWFTKLENIKEVIVQKGITGKILGTGTIYPITDTHPPFNPNNPHDQGWKRFQKLDVIKEPYKIKKILEEAIFGAKTNYIH